jgi:hypothetical protein
MGVFGEWALRRDLLRLRAWRGGARGGMFAQSELDFGGPNLLTTLRPSFPGAVQSVG